MLLLPRLDGRSSSAQITSTIRSRRGPLLATQTNACQAVQLQRPSEDLLDGLQALASCFGHIAGKYQGRK